MAKKLSNVLQFKITLGAVKPPIWRRIQVPDSYSFWDLHVAIQDAMGWLDYHLHQFDVLNPKYGEIVHIGIPDEEHMFESVLPGWKTPIKRYFISTKISAHYDYDFGDGWRHKIVLEDILPAIPMIEYPLCLAGKRNCPPEDCGGPGGYLELLKILADPKHPEYEEMIEWVGGTFNPEFFVPTQVHFDNPKERLKNSLSV